MQCHPEQNEVELKDSVKNITGSFVDTLLKMTN